MKNKLLIVLALVLILSPFAHASHGVGNGRSVLFCASAKAGAFRLADVVEVLTEYEELNLSRDDASEAVSVSSMVGKVLGRIAAENPVVARKMDPYFVTALVTLKVVQLVEPVNGVCPSALMKAANLADYSKKATTIQGANSGVEGGERFFRLTAASKAALIIHRAISDFIRDYRGEVDPVKTWIWVREMLSLSAPESLPQSRFD